MPVAAPILPLPNILLLLEERAYQQFQVEDAPTTPVRTTLLSAASGDGFGTGIFTTPAFTPPSNSLLVVAVFAMEDSGSTDPSGDISVAGGGWTYTPQVTIGSPNSFSIGLRIFTAPVTTGVSMTLDLDLAARNARCYAVSVVAYTNYNTGSPVGATGSFVQNSPAGAGESLTLSGLPATTSEVFAAIGMDKDVIGTTPGPTFSKIHELQIAGDGGIESQTRTGLASTFVDWTDVHTGAGTIFKLVGAALEIKVAAGAADQPIAGNGIPSSEAVGSPSITLNITAGGIRSEERFGASTTTPGPVTVTANGITSSETLGAPSVAISVAVQGIPGAESVGSPAVTTTYTINANGIPSAERFGAETTTISVAVNGISSSESVGSPTLAQSISASGIRSEERLGATTVTTTYTINANGITSNEALGNPLAATASSILANGIPTEERLGSPTVTTLTTINANGITSAERLGSAVTALTVAVNGISSGEQVGNPSIAVIVAINAGSITTQERLGQPTITLNVQANGITSTERLGQPAIATASTISASGIVSSERFGSSPVVPGSVTITAASIRTEEFFGRAQVSLGLLALNIIAQGIVTEQTLGYPHVGEEVIVDTTWRYNLPSVVCTVAGTATVQNIIDTVTAQNNVETIEVIFDT